MFEISPDVWHTCKRSIFCCKYSISSIVSRKLLNNSIKVNCAAFQHICRNGNRLKIKFHLKNKRFLFCRLYVQWNEHSASSKKWSCPVGSGKLLHFLVRFALLINFKIEIICKIINRPMAMGMPNTIKYIIDRTQAISLIINYLQNIKE